MRTTTIVFKFTPESSPADLDEKIEYFNSLAKHVLTSFCESHSVSSDNFVSEDINRDTCLRTVVRSWPDLATANAFIEINLREIPKPGYPGVIITAVVDPE